MLLNKTLLLLEVHNYCFLGEKLLLALKPSMITNPFQAINTDMYTIYRFFLNAYGLEPKYSTTFTLIGSFGVDLGPRPMSEPTPGWLRLKSSSNMSNVHAQQSTGLV